MAVVPSHPALGPVMLRGVLEGREVGAYQPGQPRNSQVWW